MTELFGFITAAFTAPENLGTDPKSIMLMFPLLASIAIIYKATKTRIIFPVKFTKDVLSLFVTVCVVMILAAVALQVITWLLTG
jgi:hypothetical protein